MINVRYKFGSTYENWKTSFTIFFISGKIILTLLHLRFWFESLNSGYIFDTKVGAFIVQTGLLVFFSAGFLPLITIFLVLFSFYYATEHTGFITINVLIILVLFLIAQLLGATSIMSFIANNN
jgi:hypothetical protein